MGELVKGSGVTVFAWGIGKVSLETLKKIASDPSKAILANFISELKSYLGQLEADVCNESPPPPPPPPPQPCLKQNGWACSNPYACQKKQQPAKECQQKCAAALSVCKSSCISCEGA